MATTSKAHDAITPGEILLTEVLEPLGITQYRLAQATGLPRPGSARSCAASAPSPPTPPCGCPRPSVSMTASGSTSRPTTTSSQRDLHGAELAQVTPPVGEVKDGHVRPQRGPRPPLSDVSAGHVGCGITTRHLRQSLGANSRGHSRLELQCPHRIRSDLWVSDQEVARVHIPQTFARHCCRSLCSAIRFTLTQCQQTPR